MYNNISTGHTGTNHYNLRVYAEETTGPDAICTDTTQSVDGFDSDYNIYWNSDGDVRIKWGNNSPYTDLSAFVALSEVDEEHSIEDDPKFIAPGTDLHLQSTSPAIDAADASATGWLADDFEGNCRVDNVSVTDSGAGTPDFSDRGAFEYSASNFVTNPSFEISTTGWAFYTTGTTITRVGGGLCGSSALEIAGPNNTSAFGVNDSPNWVPSTAGVGRVYRYTAWVRSASHTGIAKIKVREYSNVSPFGQVGSSTFSTGVGLSTTWQMVTIDVTVGGSNTNLDLQILDYTPVTSSEVFQVDNVGIYLLPQ